MNDAEWEAAQWAALEGATRAVLGEVVGVQLALTSRDPERIESAASKLDDAGYSLRQRAMAFRDDAEKRRAAKEGA